MEDNFPEVTSTIISEHAFVNTSKVIHVFVALCDNENQGIVPVPAKIGNGQDPGNNLYWGAAAGVKTFFKRAQEWTLVTTRKNISTVVLERIVFRHRVHDVYLVADAYDGAAIKQCAIDFFNACAGTTKDTITVDGRSIGIAGNAQLLNYTGHDGLMDFTITDFPKQEDSITRDAIILACISKNYFRKGIVSAGARPLLWSTGLMSPEAYTLKAAIDGWIKNESGEQIRERAAAAYDKYQKCGIKGARRLLVTN